MKRILLYLTLLAQASFGSALPTGGVAGYEFNRMNPVSRKFNLGTHIVDGQSWGTRAQWSFADQGGAASTELFLHDNDGQSVSIPKGAVLTDCYLDVVTAPTSSTSSGSIAWSSSDAGDLKAATFVAGYTTGSLIHCTKPSGSYTTSTMIRFTSEGFLKVKIGSEALTAGKINVYLQYILSGLL